MIVQLFNAILEHLLGHKYYAVVARTKGSPDDCFISSNVFRTRKQAQTHFDKTMATASFMPVEIITFRSYNVY